MDKKAIAQAFSQGEFELTHSHLAEDIIWNVVDGNSFKGKAAVIKQCNEIGAYFRSLSTNFRTHHVIGEGQLVVVTGTAEFYCDNLLVTNVSAGDLYVFNRDNQVVRINSHYIKRKS